MKTARWFWAGVPFVLACEREVLIEGVASDGGAGADASGAHGATTGATPSADASTGSASDSCESSYIDIAGDGETQHLVGACNVEWGSNPITWPTAYFVDGTENLVIVGCAGLNNPAPFIQIDGYSVDPTTPSTSPGGVTEYLDSTGTPWFHTQDPGDMQITVMSTEVGEFIQGSFSGTVASAGKEKALSGTFRVCKGTKPEP